ncbi:hypothetical protein PQO03_07425 [Lentisphaera profundi]|uniref:Uncharacterized protein n=1 Tax=Lentisphaera profundi TaxID=1658616 RepID=A0ABY7VTU2_9BACT|nr:hypothetical protein [Lentisphaera profundi]WDE95548.1 hypothetical protein PQO03_07425 [Lentisphaera profundi]
MRSMNTGDIRLYKVKTDYREENNLAAQMPEKVNIMDKVLRGYAGRTYASPYFSHGSFPVD